MRLKKILLIIAITLVGIIASSVVACALIPKRFDLDLNSPYQIKIYKSGVTAGQTFVSTDEEYQQIYNLYKNSYNSSILGALFNGKAFSGVTALKSYKSLDTSTLTSTADTYYIEFVYQNTQTMKVNGVDYKPSTDASAVTYNSIVIQVTDSSSLTQTEAYVRYGQDSYSQYRLVTFATQSSLYDYIGNID